MKRADMQPGVLYAIRSASYGGVRPGWVVNTNMGWKRGARTVYADGNDWLPLPRRAAGGTYVVVEVLDDVHVYERDEVGARVAFRDAYNRLVASARAAGRHCRSRTCRSR